MRDTNSQIEQETIAEVVYNPGHLLDKLISRLQLKNDRALADALDVDPPVISNIRGHRLPVGATLLIRMHEVSDLSIAELRLLMGDRREKFRIIHAEGLPKTCSNV